MTETIRYTCFDSPVGWILLAASPEGICLLDFCGAGSIESPDALARIRRLCPGRAAERSPRWPLLEEAEKALMHYLTDGVPLPALPLDVRTGTPFQKKVWEELTRIGFGETKSYQQVAEAIGRPQAMRAVGQACGRNPVAILIPCHRVLAAGGRIGGFGSGLKIKEALLACEGRPPTLTR